MRQLSGRLSEALAACWIWAHGFRIIRRNFRRRGGEIDIIAVRKSLLVFVEVRFRRNSTFGRGIETVDAAKQRRILLTAEQFVRHYPAYTYHRRRFDVVSISRPNYFPHLQWIRNAFTHDYPASLPDSSGPFPADSLRLFE